MRLRGQCVLMDQSCLKWAEIACLVRFWILTFATTSPIRNHQGSLSNLTTLNCSAPTNIFGWNTSLLRVNLRCHNLAICWCNLNRKVNLNGDPSSICKMAYHSLGITKEQDLLKLKWVNIKVTLFNSSYYLCIRDSNVNSSVAEK